MSRVIGGARPWNESEARVGQRHTPRPPTSALIDAPRQSNFSLRASFFAVNIATAATPDSHPDCRALLIKIVALHPSNAQRDWHEATQLSEVQGRAGTGDRPTAGAATPWSPLTTGLFWSTDFLRL